MRTANRGVRVCVAMCCTLLGLISACSEAGGNNSSSGTSPAQKVAGNGSTRLKTGTVGIAVATLSTSLKGQVDLLETALGKVGWTIVVTDAHNDPNVEQTTMQNFVSQRVDAIIDMYINSSTIAPQLNAAKTAGIPVLAVSADANPSLFAATYAGDPEAQAQLTTDYLKSKYPAGTHYVVLDLASIYSTNQLITTAIPHLKAAGFQQVGQFDINIADLTNSIKAGVLNLIQAHPEVKFVLGCSSICLPVMAPALQQAGYKDVLSIAADDADDVDSFAFMHQGMPIVGNVQNLEVSLLIAVDQILAHAATGAPVNRNADAGAYKSVIVTKDNEPANGAQFTGTTADQKKYFDDATLMDSYTKKWQNTYNW
jgi:ABC-type sugar transport system substrate-binding protein